MLKQAFIHHRIIKPRRPLASSQKTTPYAQHKNIPIYNSQEYNALKWKKTNLPIGPFDSGVGFHPERFDKHILKNPKTPIQGEFWIPPGVDSPEIGEML